MKKIFFPLLAVAVLATSCADKNAYTISGEIADGSYNNTVVYLKELSKDRNEPNKVIDSVTVANGTFVFKGLATTTDVRLLELTKREDDKKAKGTLIVTEPGQITVLVNNDDIVAKGTASNDAYQNYLVASKNKDTRVQATYDFVKANSKSLIGATVLIENGWMLTTNQAKELLGDLPAESKGSKAIQAIESRVAAQEKTAEGLLFTDGKAKTPDGKDVALSDFVGKSNYVLVDFWASWCPPCRKEMPELVEYYKQYKGKGLEIVGISMDDDAKAWAAGIESLNITWPQMSELTDWDNNELRKAYGVSSIPHLMLIDREGKIVARGLRGEALRNKLAELIK